MSLGTKGKVSVGAAGIALVGFVLMGVSSERIERHGMAPAQESPGAGWLSWAFGGEGLQQQAAHRRLAATGPTGTDGHGGGQNNSGPGDHAGHANPGQANGGAHGRRSPGRLSRSGPAPASGDLQFGGQHVQAAPLSPAMTPPSWDPQGYGVRIGEEQDAIDRMNAQRPSKQLLDKLRKGAAGQTAQPANHTGCNFAGDQGNALIAELQHADYACVNTLFTVSRDDALSVFSNANMRTVADEIARLAPGYAGDNRQNILQLILFLRAGYYVQFKYQDDGFAWFSADVVRSARAALDALFGNNSLTTLETNANGEVLYDALVLIDSARENVGFLATARSVVANYDDAYDNDNLRMMRNSITAAFIVLFNQGVELQGLSVADGRANAETLNTFISNNLRKLGGDQAHLVLDGGRELSRLLRYTGDIKQAASDRIRQLAGLTSFANATAPLRAIFGQFVDEYDRANCQAYGLCNYKQQLEATVLPTRHECSASIVVRAQRMSADELRRACDSVVGEEAYFHSKLATRGIPVQNDNNQRLEMVIFDTSRDYAAYSGVLFGNGTNNGGIYLEGDPAAAGNQARFIAYEQGGEVWNLNHEFAHYLDGRYNLFGDFTAGYSNTTVWWTEGLAEYISWSYLNLPNERARNYAAGSPPALSTLFQTDYGDQSRVYQGGYLAVRYMFENRASDINAMLAKFRIGDYSAYKRRIAAIGAAYDADFSGWARCIADEQSCQQRLSECTMADSREIGVNCSRSNLSMNKGEHLYMFVRVPAGTRNLRIISSDGTGDANMYVNTLGNWATRDSYNYKSANGAGNNESVAVYNAPADYVYVSLYAQEAFSGVRLSVTY
ncbi:collagenase [Lysobacter sp. BMK333-48F3]|uniref:collagenase n=1 Tax=Lysobacter sp. BMK333-48F3 TaxID=2867962 RepID=UPI001C8CC44C|nr:collagenase [Lysobacter sp. BMK333-48F3]MBX9400892.1 collagenase [Lysobacter sp. BMK333-48F3]